MTTQPRRWAYFTTERARIAVILVGLAAFLAKLLVSMGTYGTEDIHRWAGFALAVGQRGPVGIYGINFGRLNGELYNHPPLVGYYLEAVNKLSGVGVPLRVTIRAVSSAADLISSLLAFEIIRRRRSLLQSTICGIAVASSPVLFLISGYHGNTDPLFVMFVLLGSFLILDKRMALSGGVALGLAIGIKLVPIVVLPTIAVYLVRYSQELLPRAAEGFAVTFTLTWGPAILHQWDGLKQNVLAYAGNNDRPWGLVRFAGALHWSWVSEFMIGYGRYVVLLLSALIPAALTWKRPKVAMESVAMGLVAFLILSPAFAVQYLAWAVAAAFLLDIWTAALYNILGGLILYQIYDYWNGGLPWNQMAAGRLFTPYQVALLALLWAVLVAVLVRGAQRAISSSNDRDAPGGHSSTGGHGDPIAEPESIADDRPSSGHRAGSGRPGQQHDL